MPMLSIVEKYYRRFDMSKIRHYVIGIVSFVVLCAPLCGANVNPMVDFSEIAEQAMPSIVSVKSEFRKSQSQYDENFRFQDQFQFFNDDFFRHFFGMPPHSNGGRPKPPPHYQMPQIGMGSGFIVSDDGTILTNNHLITNADKVTVTTHDGKEYVAEIIGTDSSTDIAIIKISGSNFHALTLGNSDALRIGEWVVAIGNPLGLQSSLTVGVVSAKNRGNLDIASYEDFIQTDAAINHGNSGGPLLNLKGKVVGINTAIVSSTGGGYMGIGFAIPSTMAERVMEQLLETGTVTRGFLGVTLQNVNSDLAEAFSLDLISGAVITDVVPDSPAEDAGLEQGDVILSYDGIPVETTHTLRNAVSLMKPDTSIQLEVYRHGETFSVRVVIGTHPDSIGNETMEFQNKLGIEIQEFIPDDAQKYGLAHTDEGVIVSGIMPGSVASMAGIKPGTLITGINHNKITTPDEFYEELEKTADNGKVLLLTKQGQLIRYITLKIQ